MKPSIIYLLRAISAVTVLVCLVPIIGNVRDRMQAYADRNRIDAIRLPVDSASDSSSAQPADTDTKGHLHDGIAITRDEWICLHQANPDYRAWLSFESGLIAQPVVQAGDNDYYLRRSFFGEPSSQGTFFFDCATKKSDANWIIYGHDVFYDDSAMFSPLLRLKKQEDFETNRTIRLYEESEIETYDVVLVYDVTPEDYEQLNWYRTDFSSEEDLQAWLKIPEERNMIHTDDHLKYGDHFLTLQTCERTREDRWLIVVAKETGEMTWDEAEE